MTRTRLWQGAGIVRALGFTESGGPEVEQFLDLPMPAPLAGELLVEVKVAAVNPADWKIRAGLFGPVDLPAVLGAEVSGVVRGVGQDVRDFALGDEVFGQVADGSGGYAEYALINADVSAAKPPQVSFIDASTLTVAGATAYDAIAQLDLKPGQTLLINGASGGVGVAATQIARDRGVNVIGTASADRQPLVESLNATFVQYGDGVADRIKALMPDGVDAILDLAGGNALRSVIETVSDRRRVVSTADPATAAQFGGRGLELESSRRDLEALAAMVADGKLDPHVEDVIDFDHAANALAAVETGHAKGKVVITVGLTNA
jgi:NADPH:quinone reductase-like Zn-dependent oxidoreductase